MTSDLRGAFASFLRSALVGDEQGALRAATPEVERVLSNEFLCAGSPGARQRVGN